MRAPPNTAKTVADEQAAAIKGSKTAPRRQRGGRTLASVWDIANRSTRIRPGFAWKYGRFDETVLGQAHRV